MTKVVQTTLKEEEYMNLREVLRKRVLSLKEGLHLAVEKMLQEEMRLSSSDAFLTRRPLGRSGRRDLSTAHDKYLYGKSSA